MDPFAAWAVSNGLVLISQIHAWEEASSGRGSFATHLLREHLSVSEPQWLDALCDLPLGPPVIPLGPDASLSTRAFGVEAENLRRTYQIILLQDLPVLVCATLDPFAHDSRLVQNALISAFPGEEVHMVAITPHVFSRLSGIAERASARCTQAISGDAAAWGAMLGPGYQMPTVGDIVTELWTGVPQIAVVPASHIGKVAIIGACDRALAFGRTQRRIWIATPVPNDPEICDEVLQETGLTPMPVAVSPEDFETLCQRVEAAQERIWTPESETLHVKAWPDGLNEQELLNTIIDAAITMGASDIHLEPKEEKVRVRFRIDGRLQEQSPLSRSNHTSLMHAVKLAGAMRQNRVGIPQDGAGFLLHHSTRFDQRYSIMVLNESEETAVIRIFHSRVARLDDLRFAHRESVVLNWFLQQESGMVVACGPTGSGKTSTLYALLDAINCPEKKLFTVEEPVEKHFADACQIAVDPEKDLSFAVALRHVLRQDPDVILVGEMRDAESAGIAVQASLTGHQVLTTTHANDAAGVIVRLCDGLAVDPVALSLALRLVIAQRLVPQLCPFCRTSRAPLPVEIEQFPSVEVAHPQIAQAQGCPACHSTGTAGRFLIAEMMPVDPVISEMISRRRSPDEIRRYNQSEGYMPLIDQATRLLLNGEIPLDAAKLFLTKPLV